MGQLFITEGLEQDRGFIIFWLPLIGDQVVDTTWIEGHDILETTNCHYDKAIAGFTS